MDLPFVSILLPVRGEQEELVACLASIAAQTYPHDRFEVLIADASDVPVSPELLPSGIDARVVPNPDRLMTHGLNRVAREARGAYLAIVSAHSALPGDYLERMTASAVATGAANTGTRIRKVANSAWGRAIAAATSSPVGVGGSVQHHGSTPGPADSAFPGFVERTAFDEVGGFNMDLACNEDDEFNARLRALGREVWFEPAVEVEYHPRETLAAVFRQYYRYGRWKVAVARLGIPGYLRTRHVIPSAVVSTGAGLALAALWRRALLAPLAALTATYAGLAVLAARRVASEHGASILRTAAAFPVLHAGYGLGFLRGVLDRDLPNEVRTDVRGAAGTGEIAYRPLSAADLHGAAGLHEAVFSDYFLGHMGTAFLELFYGEFVDRPGNYGFVAVQSGRVVGAVVGAADLSGFYPDFYRRHFAKVSVMTAARLVRDGFIRRHIAARAPHLATAVRSRLGRGEAPAPDPDAWPPAQLLSIGVAADHRGRGIADGLTQLFCAALAADGVEAVGLTVFNDNGRAIRFYEKDGWRVQRTDEASTAFWMPLTPEVEAPVREN